MSIQDMILAAEAEYTRLNPETDGERRDPRDALTPMFFADRVANQIWQQLHGFSYRKHGQTKSVRGMKSYLLELEEAANKAFEQADEGMMSYEDCIDALDRFEACKAFVAAAEELMADIETVYEKATGGRCWVAPEEQKARAKATGPAKLTDEQKKALAERRSALAAAS